MRWDGLFQDLEHRFEDALAAEAAAEALDEVRARHAARTLRDRLFGEAATVVVATRGGAVLPLAVEAVGADWLAGTALAGRASLLVPLASIAWLRAEPAEGASPAEPPASRERIGLAIALRELARRRAVVELALVGDRPAGTIDRVGADHLDLAVHALEQPRRPAAVAAIRLVPLAAIDHLRWRG